MADASLVLRGLRIAGGDRTLVDGVDLDLRGGRITALVGPSGAGKSLTARALLGLVDLEPGVVAADLEIRVDGRVLRPWDDALGRPLRARDRAFAGVRGAAIGLVSQDARGALDPVRRIGWQVAYAGAPGAPVDVTDCLRRAGLDDPDRVAALYPHQVSGGMAQRVAIAQALARRSPLLVVDEPTSGLDAVGVAALCALLAGLAADGLGLLLITHDLRIVPGLAHEIVVMAGGTVVERAPPDALADVRSAAARDLVGATRRIAGARLG